MVRTSLRVKIFWQHEATLRSGGNKQQANRINCKIYHSFAAPLPFLLLVI
jgi:hypothetical protein